MTDYFLTYFLQINSKRKMFMKEKKYNYVPNGPHEILTAKEIKEKLKCGINRAYDLMKSPAFPSIKLGGRYIVTASAFNRWLIENENKHFYL